MTKTAYKIANFDNFDEAVHTVDTTALAEVIKDAFLLAMDDRLTESQQGQLAANARALRVQLQQVLGRVITAGTQELDKANATLKQVNKDLKKAQASIEKVADTVEGLGALVKQLDTLLQIAGLVL